MDIVGETLIVSVVSPSTIPDISLIAQPSTSICLGDVITFKTISVNTGPAPVYEWLIDGLIVQNGPVDSLVTNVLANGSHVEVILHSGLLCNSPTTDTASLMISVSSSLVPKISISADTAVCPGSPLILTTSSINGGGTPTFQWFENGNPIAGATSSSYSFVVTLPDTVISVQMISSLSCVSVSSALDTSIINLLQNIQANVTLSANPSGTPATPAPPRPACSRSPSTSPGPCPTSSRSPRRSVCVARRCSAQRWLACRCAGSSATGRPLPGMTARRPPR